MSATYSSTTSQVFDVIVIGAGPVGETLAGLVAAEGLRTVLVEHDLVGGDCAYYACKPSKALLRPVEIAANTQHLEGIASTRVVADDLLSRRDHLVSSYDDSGQKQTLESAGITVVRGHGRLNGERTVEVHGADGATQTLHADRSCRDCHHRYHTEYSTGIRGCTGVGFTRCDRSARGTGPVDYHWWGTSGV